MAADPLAPPLPRHVQLEVTGACNLACAMCLVRYRPRLGKATGAMCLHTFRSVVDALPDLERVTLQGLGEPLLAPDLDAMVEHAASRGVDVGFNTNGILLTPVRAERLVRAGAAWIHVSLDGATAETHEGIRDGVRFETVVAHLRALAAAARDHGRDGRPIVTVVFVAMRRNVDELPALVRLAADAGVHRVHVQNLSHDFADTDPAGAYAGIRDFAAAEALWESRPPPFDEAAAEAARLGVDLRLPRAGGCSERGGVPCSWPFDAAYVTHRGSVQPCCMVMGADRVSLGDVATRPFDAVWHGDAYRAFRAALLSPEPPAVCRGCSLYRGVF